jgi:hypothetical protein
VSASAVDLRNVSGSSQDFGMAGAGDIASVGVSIFEQIKISAMKIHRRYRSTALLPLRFPPWTVNGLPRSWLPKATGGNQGKQINTRGAGQPDQACRGIDGHRVSAWSLGEARDQMSWTTRPYGGRSARPTGRIIAFLVCGVGGQSRKSIGRKTG